MRKALVTGPNELVIANVPDRAPGAGEARARMLLTTLSTANLRLYEGPLLADLVYPVTLSYTGVAQVTDVGPGVTGLKPGDLVYPNFYRACGHCRWCLADKKVACENVPVGGHNMMIGGQYESALQDAIVMSEERLQRVPAGTSIESAALIGPFAVAMQAIVAVEPDERDTLFINGSGPIGWCAIQLARLRGARTVVCEIEPARMARAREFGADAVIDGGAPDAAAQIIAACGGPAIKIIEATGSTEGSALAFQVAGRGAHIAAAGVSSYPIIQAHLVLKGLRIDGISGSVRVAEIIQLVADGKIDISSAISHRFPFSRLQEALDFKRTHKEAEMVAVYMDESDMPRAEGAAAA